MKLSIAQIAAACGGHVIGNADYIVNRLLIDTLQQYIDFAGLEKRVWQKTKKNCLTNLHLTQSKSGLTKSPPT